MFLSTTLGKIHRRLIPEWAGQGILPYIWLAYLGFIYFPLIVDGGSTVQWLVVVSSTLLFLFVYFWVYWQVGYRSLLGIVAICLIGAVNTGFTDGASAYFVYAGSFCFLVGSISRGVYALAGVLTFVGVISLILNLSPFFFLPAAFFTLFIGGINIYQKELEQKNRLLKLSQEEVKQLAATAERERIARDLHDLVGHTLSMITLKAQLARKLVRKDLDAAETELKELEATSRQTLADVREAVTGYKQRDLISELTNAKQVFHTADLEFVVATDIPELPNHVNNVLAMVIKELVTNTIKHSNGNKVCLSFEKATHRLSMTFVDNGVVTHFTQGNGIRGLKERLADCKGTLCIQTNNGFEVMVEIAL